MILSARDKISAGRIGVLNRHPYYSRVLMRLRPVETPLVQTMGVDEGLRLWFNPEFLKKLSTQECACILAHEVQHVIRRHMQREPALAGRLTARFRRVMPIIQQRFPMATDFHLFANVCEDLEINDDHERAGWKWPEVMKPLLPATHGLADNLTFEQYAVNIITEAEKQAQQQQSKPASGKGQKRGSGGSQQTKTKAAPGEGAGEPEELDDQAHGAAGGSEQRGDREEEPREDAGADGDGDAERGDGAGDPGVSPGLPHGSGEAEGTPGGVGATPGDGSAGGVGGSAPGDGAGERAAQGVDGSGQGGVAGHPGAGRCGGCTGAREKHESTGSAEGVPPPVTPDVVELDLRAVAHAAVSWQQAHGRGTAPGNWLLEWSRKMLEKPKADWRRVLAHRAREAVAGARGVLDQSMEEPSRERAVMRQWMGNKAPLLPGDRGGQARAAVVCDTSGSTLCNGGARMKRIASELMGISRASGLPLFALAVDARVQEARQVRTAADIEKLMKGGGGTDMAFGVRAVVKDKKLRANVVIVLTDGKTPWPRRTDVPPEVTVVVMVVNTDRSCFEDMPRWLRKSSVFVDEPVGGKP